MQCPVITALVRWFGVADRAPTLTCLRCQEKSRAHQGLCQRSHRAPDLVGLGPNDSSLDLSARGLAEVVRDGCTFVLKDGLPARVCDHDGVAIAQ